MSDKALAHIDPRSVVPLRTKAELDQLHPDTRDVSLSVLARSLHWKHWDTDEKYQRFLAGVTAAHAVSGRLSFDHAFAMRMLRERAATLGQDYAVVANASEGKLWEIVLAALNKKEEGPKHRKARYEEAIHTADVITKVEAAVAGSADDEDEAGGKDAPDPSTYKY